MAGKRTTRLNEQFKREIAQIIQSDVKDPRVGLCMVTGANVAPDLSSAQVFVAISGEEEEKQETLKALKTAAPFIRSQIAQRLTIRRSPALHFVRDESVAYGSRIEQLLSEVRAAEKSPDPTEPDRDDS